MVILVDDVGYRCVRLRRHMQVKQNDEACMENSVVAWSCFPLVGRLIIPDIQGE